MQSTESNRLNNKEGSRRNAWIYLGSRNRVDFMSGLWAGRWEQEGSSTRNGAGMEGEITGRDDWSWGAFQGRGRNLVQ